MKDLIDLYKDYPNFGITLGAERLNSIRPYMRHGYHLKSADFKRPWTTISLLYRFWRIVVYEKPTHVISMYPGSSALPIFLLSRLKRLKFIYIDASYRANRLRKIGQFLMKMGVPVISQWDIVNRSNIHDLGTSRTEISPIPQNMKGENIVFIWLGPSLRTCRKIIEEIESLMKDGYLNDKVVIYGGTERCKKAIVKKYELTSADNRAQLLAAANFAIIHEDEESIAKCLQLGKRFIILPRDFGRQRPPSKRAVEEDFYLRLSDSGFAFIAYDREQL